MNKLVGPKTVIDCYSFIDALSTYGFADYAQGRYYNDPNVLYDEAHANEAEYLLNETKCVSGSKILEIGCGNGRILETAKRRGANATGITIATGQFESNNARGLKTLLMNYKDIPQEWNGQFDAVIANGSMEHSVQLDDAVADKGDQIYAEEFSIMHRILKPGARLVTTVLHFRQYVDPQEIKKGIKAFKRGSPNFHWALLADTMGGWYPKDRQLIKCAKPYFRNIRREDGTEDYRHTSEEWLKI